jgi:NADH-quinone oxidoreductase subunit G
MISPMLPCEEAYALAKLARALDPDAILGLGPVPVDGEDKHFPPDSDNPFVMRAEKAPNARGVARVLEAFGGLTDYDQTLDAIRSDRVGAAIVTGNYPSDWSSDALIDAMKSCFTLLIDTLGSPLVEAADVVLPGATWLEKAGTFENADNILQAFERAIEPIDYCKCEAQIALDLIAAKNASTPAVYNAANIRQAMAGEHGLAVFVSDVHLPVAESVPDASDMEFVEL